MRIYDDEMYIKNVPKKFEPIKEQIPGFVSKEGKYLNNNERAILNKVLLKHLFSEFMGCLKVENKAAYDYLSDRGDEVKHLRRVVRRDNSVEYRVAYKNGIEVRVPRSDFPHVDYERGYAW